MSNTTTTTNKTMSIERHTELTQQLRTIFREFEESNTNILLAFESYDTKNTSVFASGVKTFLHFCIAKIFQGILESEKKS
jgi:hypothetical protein